MNNPDRQHSTEYSDTRIIVLGETLKNVEMRDMQD